MDNVQISVGPYASNAYVYILDSEIIDPQINNFNKEHKLTYDYAFNSIYISFHNEKSIIIDLTKSIGEILNFENSIWTLPCLNTDEKYNIFKLLLSKTIESVKFIKSENVQEEIQKLKQILNLLI